MYTARYIAQNNVKGRLTDGHQAFLAYLGFCWNLSSDIYFYCPSRNPTHNVNSYYSYSRAVKTRGAGGQGGHKILTGIEAKHSPSSPSPPYFQTFLRPCYKMVAKPFALKYNFQILYQFTKWLFSEPFCYNKNFWLLSYFINAIFWTFLNQKIPVRNKINSPQNALAKYLWNVLKNCSNKICST